MSESDFFWVPSHGGDAHSARTGDIDRVPSDGLLIQPNDYWNNGKALSDSELLCEGYLKKIRGWARVSSIDRRSSCACVCAQRVCGMCVCVLPT